MSSGGSAIRGSRIGAGPMGEQDRGFKAQKIERSYYCSNKHSFSPSFSAELDIDEIPVELDCPHCGLPSGQDPNNPPVIAKHEPYKTHLAYVKERRTAKEAKDLLDEAVAAVRSRRQLLEAQAKAAEKAAAKAEAKAASDKAKAAAKPATKPATKPAAKATAKPAAKPVTKPAGKPAEKKVTKPAAKPAAKKVTKPAAKPAAKPVTKSAAKPAAKKIAKPTKKK
jgi:Tfp pilus assembly protein FimV